MNCCPAGGRCFSDRVTDMKLERMLSGRQGVRILDWLPGSDLDVDIVGELIYRG